MSATAYLILHIDTETRKVVRAGIYSERCPTTFGHICPVVYAEITADNFGKARDLLHDAICTGWRDKWLHPVYPDAPKS